MPVVGLEGQYEVSDAGDVRSLDRVVTRKDGRQHRVTGKTLKGWCTPAGHRSVYLAGKVCYVHRVVLTAFVGPCPDGMEGCHNNGNPTDNRLENLRWGTRSENSRDTVRHGRNLNSQKTHCPQGHPYDSANTRVIRSRPNARYCIACNDARHAAA